MMGAHLGLHLKNERKTKFRQLRVKTFGKWSLHDKHRANQIISTLSVRHSYVYAYTQMWFKNNLFFTRYALQNGTTIDTEKVSS